MSGQVSITRSRLHDWVDLETRPLDVVASWESLCDTYDALKFIDPLSDSVRLEEFKWIIKEMNKFLTRIRNQLMKCMDPTSMVIVLQQNWNPSGQVNIDGRRSLAYQKLKQRWLSQMIAQATAIEEELKKEESTNGNGNGWTEPGDGGKSVDPGFY